MRRRNLALLALLAALAVALPARASNDSLYPRQWALQKIGAGYAFDRGAIGTGITVGIVDSGIDLGHEEFVGRIAASTNCVGASTPNKAGSGDAAKCQGTGQDDSGHGTHVAGIIAADADNGTGISGVAPGARLVVAKALAADGSGSIDDIGAGIRWAIAEGAKVINLSLGIESNSSSLFKQMSTQALESYINEAWAGGALVVVAAGNNSSQCSNYTSVDAIVVTATDKNDAIAPYASCLNGTFSSVKWGMAAPGGGGKNAPGASSGASCPDVNIVSTYWYAGSASSYACSAGTSMSAPHVAGAAAILRALGLSRDATRDRLLATATKAGPESSYGAGILDISAAVAPFNLPVKNPPATTGTTRPVRVRAAGPVRKLPAAAPTTAPPPPTTTTTLPPTTEPPTTTTTGRPQLALGPASHRGASNGQRAAAIVIALVGLVTMIGSGGAVWRQRRASISSR